jgi:hypothetical protein
VEWKIRHNIIKTTKGIYTKWEKVKKDSSKQSSMTNRNVQCITVQFINLQPVAADPPKQHVPNHDSEAVLLAVELKQPFI